MTTTKRYEVKCDDCKSRIRFCDTVAESAAGGRCYTCKANTCPGCSGTLKASDEHAQASTCTACGGLVIVSGIYLGDSYAIVSPAFESGPYDLDEQRYFDITCTGSEGITRRHGFYLPRTGRLTQVG